MNQNRFRTFALAALLMLGTAGFAGAADHLDNTGLTPPGGDIALDIADLFAFVPANDPDSVVMAMTVNGLTPPGTEASFATRGSSYRFEVDTDGDAVREMTFIFRFGRTRPDGSQRIRGFVRGEPSEMRGRIGKGWTTPLGDDPVINTGRNSIDFFAGQVDDPFFFDLFDFLELDFCSSDVADTFAGSNVSVIAVRLPKAQMPADLAIWAETFRGGKQIDRKGRPAINTVFIPSNVFEPNEASQKQAFNEGHPANDQRDFRAEVVDTLEIFYPAGDPTIDALADILLPDVLTINTDTPSGFLNGRRPQDDVIDAELGLVTNGAVTTDCVDGNDKAFRTTFPYFAAAHE